MTSTLAMTSVTLADAERLMEQNFDASTDVFDFMRHIVVIDELEVEDSITDEFAMVRSDIIVEEIVTS